MGRTCGVGRTAELGPGAPRGGKPEAPIGEVIVARADGAVFEAEREVTAFQSLIGRGIRARLDGTPHYARKPDPFRDQGFDLEDVHAAGDTTDESSTGTTGSDVGTEPRPATPAETSSESGAGFGPALAVIALLAAALLTGRRPD